ncbi:ABC transporter ATP-binding protein [Salinibacterium sp.]|uniref:ABC transporter ATP-binding protein n=1 Tax=Salinibacterium sp. TaxID=1915057 RepID=UPI00286B13F7|nr:ABC transporter ATP-binding protein [Salinibacterium sp.]
MDLLVHAGDFLLLRGASGSGKSTLLNVIGGLQPLDSGEVLVAGTDVASADDDTLARLRLEHVGVVFQENNLIREFDASENVQLPLRARGFSGSAALEDAKTMLGSVGLGELARRMPSQLSGGQRQRVGIARALVGGRSVLLADEPTGALDSKNSLAIFRLLRTLADDGVCVVVASHDRAAERFASRMAQMSDGSLSLEPSS